MEDRIKKIKSGAHWRVNIRPTTFKKDKIPTLSEVRRIVEQCKVCLMGWNYPHISQEETKNGDDWVQSGCDWNGLIEYWRFYRSVQFIHYFACFETYRSDAQERAKSSFRIIQPPKEPSGYIDITSTLYRITAIYEFAMRLAQKDIIEHGVYISIKLSGIENHQLFFWDSSRFLPNAYISAIDEINLESTMEIEELIGRGHDEAINKAISFFERFNWVDPPRGIIIEHQKKLLERRL